MSGQDLHVVMLVRRTASLACRTRLGISIQERIELSTCKYIETGVNLDKGLAPPPPPPPPNLLRFSIQTRCWPPMQVQLSNTLLVNQLAPGCDLGMKEKLIQNYSLAWRKRYILF